MIKYLVLEHFFQTQLFLRLKTFRRVRQASLDRLQFRSLFLEVFLELFLVLRKPAPVGAQAAGGKECDQNSATMEYGCDRQAAARQKTSTVRFRTEMKRVCSMIFLVQMLGEAAAALLSASK